MVYTVQTVVGGVTAGDKGLPGRVVTALELHGASDPVAVYYPDDRELGIVLQWGGDLEICFGCLLCALSSLTQKGYIKEVHVEEEPEMQAFNPSADGFYARSEGRHSHAPLCPLLNPGHRARGHLTLLADNGGVA